MKSINFVIVGDYYHQIASELGKKGTTTDLSIYDRKTQDTIYTWAVPITFYHFSRQNSIFNAGSEYC